MAFAGNYAALYDLLYADKPYAREVEFALAWARGRGVEPRRVVDYGCGTGKHSRLFAAAGCDVTGVDINPNMLAIARERSAGGPAIRFLEAKDREQVPEGSVDLFVTFFDVLSYMTGNAEVADFLAFVRRSLRPGGLFLFDFWYGPGVLGLGPERRWKEYSNDDMRVLRLTSPTVDWTRSIVNVKHDMLVFRGDRFERFDELHAMRYFFINEIEQFAAAAGLKVVGFGTWDTFGTAPGTADWSALVGATTV